jgi:hypothetical protein
MKSSVTSARSGNVEAQKRARQRPSRPKKTSLPDGRKREGSGEEMRRWFPTLEKRFWAKVKKGKPNECWEWMACLNNGYGRIGFPIDGVTYTHRLSYILYHGKIPDGLLILHKCDNRRCVNPRHLMVGTIQDNIRDRDAKGRASSGENHFMSKSTWKTIQKIRKEYASGKFFQRELAKKYGYCIEQIRNIITYKFWKVKN